VNLRHPLVPVVVAAGLAVPWVALVGSGTVAGLGTSLVVLVSGLAVLGASFLLAWGAETAEKDVPRAFAIAVLAVLAVLPEYAVDALYAWTAGAKGATITACRGVATGEHAAVAANGGLEAGCQAANLAVANMTGANRILIGLGWSGIALYTVYQARFTGDPAVRTRDGWLADRVTLDRSLATEITFLSLATLWAFLVPLGGGIGALDTIVLVGLYLVYIGLIIRSGISHDVDHTGVPAYFQRFARPVRLPVVVGLFATSGALIFSAVEPFAHGLEELGIALGLPPFFMIQWIAPLASESPELIVVAVLVAKARSTAGMNALISSKLNQWTLLIGTIAVVYSIALTQYGVLPFDAKQAAEIWITAAQSLFAIALLVDFSISQREAVALLGLFLSQVLAEFAILRFLGEPVTVGPLSITSIDVLLAYTAVYLVLGVVLLWRRRTAVVALLGRTGATARAALGRGPDRAEADD
jgi:cation:H+ antiporter